MISPEAHRKALDRLKALEGDVQTPARSPETLRPVPVIRRAEAVLIQIGGPAPAPPALSRGPFASGLLWTLGVIAAIVLVITVACLILFGGCLAIFGGAAAFHAAAPTPTSSTAKSAAAPTAPAEPNIVTRSAYMRCALGMSYADVAAKVGRPGMKQSSSPPGSEVYAWTNPDGSSMTAAFQDGKLVEKAQERLR